MDRRNFIKNGLMAGLATAFAPLEAVAQSGKRNYIEYYLDVCFKLDGLKDYRSGEVFRQSNFVIAYFATPYNLLPREGCATDALNIYSSKRWAEDVSGQSIEPVIVFTPREEGDPDPDFAVSITDSSAARSNFSFKGLTGSKKRIFEIAQNYRASFDIDRKSGQILGHSRGAILISPKGELVAQYLPHHLAGMGNDMASHIKAYKNRQINLVQGCEF